MLQSLLPVPRLQLPLAKPAVPHSTVPAKAAAASQSLGRRAVQPVMPLTQALKSRQGQQHGRPSHAAGHQAAAVAAPPEQLYRTSAAQAHVRHSEPGVQPAFQQPQPSVQQTREPAPVQGHSSSSSSSWHSAAPGTSAKQVVQPTLQAAWQPAAPEDSVNAPR